MFAVVAKFDQFFYREIGNGSWDSWVLPLLEQVKLACYPWSTIGLPFYVVYEVFMFWLSNSFEPVHADLLITTVYNRLFGFMKCSVGIPFSRDKQLLSSFTFI